jgi:hypothetical protein
MKSKNLEKFAKVGESPVDFYYNKNIFYLLFYLPFGWRPVRAHSPCS